MSNKTVLIFAERLEELIKAEALLLALQAGGVDNWEWYSASIEDHYEEPDIRNEVVNF